MRRPTGVSRDAGLLLGLCAVAAGAVLAGVMVGPTPLGAERLAAALVGAGTPGDAIVIWQIRAPRSIAAFLVGAALGLSGAALQGLLRNPLAEPGVLGVSASAALAATSALAFGVAAVWPFAPAAAAIGGALAATALIGAAALRTSGVVALILIGVGLSSFAGALMALVLNLAPNPFALSDLVSWMLGSVANRSFSDIALVAPILAAGVILLRLSGRGLTVLSLGEEAAAGAGLDLVRTRLLVIVGAGLATGASVALAGAIGFVGIVAPHLARPLVGHDPARTLAPSALMGGAMLALADVLARIAPGDTELRLGVVAALIGAPAFVWIAARRGGEPV